MILVIQHSGEGIYRDRKRREIARGWIWERVYCADDTEDL